MKCATDTTQKESSLSTTTSQTSRSLVDAKNELKEYDFKLDLDLIVKLLQGLEVVIATGDIKLKIHPPVNGVLFTHEEFKQIHRMAQASGPVFAMELQEIMRRKFEK